MQAAIFFLTFYIFSDSVCILVRIFLMSYFVWTGKMVTKGKLCLWGRKFLCEYITACALCANCETKFHRMNIFKD